MFVWTFDHGGYNSSTGSSFLYLLNETIMWDYEFAELTNQINANKKVFWMQQCYSGGFSDDLENSTTVFHSACQSYEKAYSVDDKDINGNLVWESETINEANYPHGEFNFHNYSAIVGESPAHENNYNGQPYTEADENNDNFISLQESYNWEDSHESITMVFGEDPLYSDLGNIGLNTTLEYPTLLYEDILSNISFRGLIGISKTIHVLSGSELTINSNAELHLLNDATLVIDEGASLVIQNNVKIFGNYNNNIQVNGNINIGENVSFGNELVSFGGLFLNNKLMETIFTGTTFNRSGFRNYGKSLDINNCTFNKCENEVYSLNGNITINNAAFNETWLLLQNNSNIPEYIASVTDCRFTKFGLCITNYGQFLIENNDIDAIQYGIQIYNSGCGRSGYQMILGNNIHNCKTSGIMAYNVTGSITNNNIHDNTMGIKLMNNCNISLYGNAPGQNQTQTQHIVDNVSYEVYCTEFSFPWYFRYNEIIDEDNIGNPTDPMVFYDRPNPSPYIKLDVRNNCWGSNFNPYEDFKANYSTFYWDPTWCSTGIGPTPDPIEDLYLSGVQEFEIGNYSNAKNLFQLLIQQYPHSEYAEAAMKELLRLEEYNTSDYEGLKDYYESNDSIISDSLLRKLGDYLSNQCDIKLANWPQAISWFESKIEYPTCIEDSLFAIIDLGHVYFLMENEGLKSTYVGHKPQFKPKSKEEYFKHRNFLLSLLPDERRAINNSPSNVSFGSLLNNVPNPFDKSTEIWYKVEKSVNVSISITEMTGREISKIEQGIKDKGTYSAFYVNSEMVPGTYFCLLKLDGTLYDSKKMIVIK